MIVKVDLYFSTFTSTSRNNCNCNFNKRSNQKKLQYRLLHFFFSFHFLALLFQPIKNAFRLAKFNLDGFCKKHLEVSKEKHFPRVKTNLKKILFNLQQRCRICWKIESSGVKIVSVCCLSNCKKELSIIFIRNARRITSKRRVARWVTINGRKCGSHTLRVIRICSARLTM